MTTLPASITAQQPSGMNETLIIDNTYATAEVALFGAHMLSFIPKHDQHERLYMSDLAVMDGTKSIRGGVPICWPWFGGLNEGYQIHGYARNRVWELTSALDKEDCTELIFNLADTQGEGFTGEADLCMTICIGRTLSMSLKTTNVGSETFELSTALHTYFAVEDISDVELVGMSGDYSDKANNWGIGTTPIPYKFSGETDRVHSNPVKELVIVDGGHRIKLQSSGHDSVVVWNPGAELSQKMSDMTADGYTKMLCVETAVTQGKQLAAGESHSLGLVID